MYMLELLFAAHTAHIGCATPLAPLHGELGEYTLKGAALGRGTPLPSSELQLLWVNKRPVLCDRLAGLLDMWFRCVGLSCFGVCTH
jgi:hypothetical protein